MQVGPGWRTPIYLHRTTTMIIMILYQPQYTRMGLSVANTPRCDAVYDSKDLFIFMEGCQYAINNYVGNFRIEL